MLQDLSSAAVVIGALRIKVFKTTLFANSIITHLVLSYDDTYWPKISTVLPSIPISLGYVKVADF